MLFNLMIAIVVQSEVVKIDDFKAAYDQNTSLASTLRIRCEYERKEVSSRAAFHSAVADQFEKNLTLIDTPSDVRTRVETAIKDHRRLAEAGRTAKTGKLLTVQQDFWTDGSHFQVRSPLDRKKGTPFTYGTAMAVEYPNLEVSRDILPTTFKDIYILSYLPGASPSFRSWDARTINTGTGLHSGQIQNSNRHPECYFPPLTHPQTEWGGKPNPIDDLFNVYLANGRGTVLGEVVLRGMKTSLIDVQLPADQSGMILSARAFLDIDRGALPLRIEFFNGPLDSFRDFKGICFDHKQLRAAFVVTDIELREYKHKNSSFWYPQAGVIQRLSRAASAAEAVSPAQPDMCVREMTTWRVLDLELDRPMSRENFEFDFPEQTLFVNGPTGELMISGDADGVAKRYVQGSIAGAPRQTAQWPYWLGGGVFSICLLFAWRRWRGKIVK